MFTGSCRGTLSSMMLVVKKSMDTVKDKGERMQETLVKLERAQSSMDERLQQCNMAKQALHAEIGTTDKLFTRSNQENMATEEKMLSILGEQMTVQKGSAGAASHIQKKQKAVLHSQVNNRNNHCSW